MDGNLCSLLVPKSQRKSSQILGACFCSFYGAKECMCIGYYNTMLSNPFFIFIKPCAFCCYVKNIGGIKSITVIQLRGNKSRE